MATTTTTTVKPNPSEPRPSPLRHALETKGYVLLPSILTPTELSTLRTAAASATTLARTSQWPHIRTLPKQFPPWPSTPGPDGIWGVQHLLHPSLPSSPTFAASYFHPLILSAACEILSSTPSASQLVMELYNLLVTPDHDFSLRWHRDDIPPTATPAEEEERLSKPILHAQWNLALYDDESLLVVPGSQKRARTQAERDAGPYEEDIEGMVGVSVRAGDVVFYDNNILHTGRYKTGRERATLHGSIGLRGGDRDRARNVLQHGVGRWVGECDFSGLEGEWEGRKMGEVAEGMRRGLVEMGTGEGVGWSQGGEE
ncbi:hypothetical protein BDZ85DRAFT_244186 [Elsinoe ampelina]|uniref:Phytanoyl-CoA dioxygenase family protein n=1 Tax=Elsinoe ampelina TaxID=302913 RepID=A0A6A6FZX0_9PEZI|nr:hypothetical protein BDZ85DRAFT_244186 [Elsinoe ampelina]